MRQKGPLVECSSEDLLDYQKLAFGVKAVERAGGRTGERGNWGWLVLPGKSGFRGTGGDCMERKIEHGTHRTAQGKAKECLHGARLWQEWMKSSGVSCFQAL
jgi:hypothetical protein